jgi:hypothetical protein
VALALAPTSLAPPRVGAPFFSGVAIAESWWQDTVSEWIPFTPMLPRVIVFIMSSKHPEICVTLDAAGDDFRVIDRVIKAMRRAGVPAGEIEQFCDEALSSDDRDLLRICGRWVTLAPV